MTTSRSGHEAAVMTPVEGWAALDAVVGGEYVRGNASLVGMRLFDNRL